MIINEDLVIENKTLGEIDDKLTRGTTVKNDVLFDGNVVLDSNGSKSLNLSHPWTDYDILYIVAGAGASQAAAVELTTIPLYIMKKNGYNQTYSRLWSNIPASYNAIIRLSVNTSNTSIMSAIALLFTTWTTCNVFKVYGIKFIS